MEYILVSLLIILGVLLCGLKKIKEYYITDNEKPKFVSVKIWGRKCFKETFYYKTGELNKTKYWLMGLLLSSVTYYRDGNIYVIEKYRKGKLSEVKVFDASGKMISNEKF